MDEQKTIDEESSRVWREVLLDATVDTWRRCNISGWAVAFPSRLYGDDTRDVSVEIAFGTQPPADSPGDLGYCRTALSRGEQISLGRKFEGFWWRPVTTSSAMIRLRISQADWVDYRGAVGVTNDALNALFIQNPSGDQLMVGTYEGSPLEVVAPDGSPLLVANVPGEPFEIYTPSDRPLYVTQPAGTWVSGSTSVAPSANTVLVDTGQIPAGVYRVHGFVSLYDNAGKKTELQYRNAANSATIAAQVAVTSLTPTIQRVDIPYLTVTNDNERIRWQVIDAGAGGSVYQASIFYQRIT